MSKFPFKLYDVLEAAEYSRAISWMPDGRSFRVYDDDMFVDHVLPKFSKATKLRSFHRQLNLWAFNRGQEDSSTWHHPLFIRGRPELLSNIIRVSKPSLRADTNTTFEEVLLGQSQESNCGKSKRQSGDDDGVVNNAATSTNGLFTYDSGEAAVSLSMQSGNSTSSRAIDSGQSHQYQYQSQHSVVNSFLINHAYESTVGTITSSQPEPPPKESTVSSDSSAIFLGDCSMREAPDDDEFSTFIGKNIHPT